LRRRIPVMSASMTLYQARRFLSWIVGSEARRVKEMTRRMMKMVSIIHLWDSMCAYFSLRGMRKI
jgi:hypothetical protein